MYQRSKSVICYSWREISAGPRGHLEYNNDNGYGAIAYTDDGFGAAEGALALAHSVNAKLCLCAGHGHTDLGGELSGFEQLVLNQYTIGSMRFSHG